MWVITTYLFSIPLTTDLWDVLVSAAVSLVEIDELCSTLILAISLIASDSFLVLVKEPYAPKLS